MFSVGSSSSVVILKITKFGMRSVYKMALACGHLVAVAGDQEVAGRVKAHAAGPPQALPAAVVYIAQGWAHKLACSNAFCHDARSCVHTCKARSLTLRTGAQRDSPCHSLLQENVHSALVMVRRTTVIQRNAHNPAGAWFRRQLDVARRLAHPDMPACSTCPSVSLRSLTHRNRVCGEPNTALLNVVVHNKRLAMDRSKV